MENKIRLVWDFRGEDALKTRGLLFEQGIILIGVGVFIKIIIKPITN